MPTPNVPNEPVRITFPQTSQDAPTVTFIRDDSGATMWETVQPNGETTTWTPGQGSSTEDSES